jgi:hypothetical protein
MTWETLLSHIDPSTLSIGALAILGIGLFVWKKAFPWFTEVYFPARTKRLEVLDQERSQTERERTAIFAMMRDSLVELRVLAGAQTNQLNQLNISLQTLLEQHSALLETLREKV